MRLDVKWQVLITAHPDEIPLIGIYCQLEKHCVQLGHAGIITLPAACEKKKNKYKKKCFFMDVQPKTKTNGFTLVELMITLAIVAILATVAFPSMQSSIANNRVRSHGQDIASILSFARSEAISRGIPVVVTPVNSWLGGASVSANGAAIQELPALVGSTNITNNSASYTFDPRGLTINNTAIVVNHNDSDNEVNINISAGGAITVSEGPK
ncbi:GspH/FimT family pseudopilin [Endozoicomonas sp. 2B-B]